MDREFEIKAAGSSWKKNVTANPNKFAADVVKTEFPDVLIPGEYDGANRLRFYSPTWGWIYITEKKDAHS
jgi:hypothetical protein